MCGWGGLFVLSAATLSLGLACVALLAEFNTREVRIAALSPNRNSVHANPFETGQLIDR